MPSSIEYIVSLEFFDAEQVFTLSQLDERCINAMVKAFPQLERAGFNSDEILEGVVCGANFEAIAEIINELEFNSTVIVAFNWNVDQLWELHTHLGLCSVHFERILELDHILEKNQGKQRVELLSSLANLFKALHLKPKAIQTILCARNAAGMIGEILRFAVHPTFAERKIAIYFGSKKNLEKYIDIVLTLKITKKMLRAIQEDIGLVELLKELNLSESRIHFLCMYSRPSKIAAIKSSSNLLKNLKLSELELMILLTHNDTEALLDLCHKFTEFNVPIETINLFFKQKEPIADVFQKAFILLDTKKFPKETLTILEGNACRLYGMNFWLSLQKMHLDSILTDVENGPLKLLFIDMYFDLFISLPMSITSIMIIYRHEKWQTIIHELFVHVETLKLFTEFQVMQLISVPDLAKTLSELKEQLPGFLQNGFSTDFIIKLITKGPIHPPKLIFQCIPQKSYTQDIVNTAPEGSAFIGSKGNESPMLCGFWRPASPELQLKDPAEFEVEKISVNEEDLGNYLLGS